MSAGFRGIQDLETNLEWRSNPMRRDTDPASGAIAAEGSLIDSLA
jgi:hypothetical protein